MADLPGGVSPAFAGHALSAGSYAHEDAEFQQARACGVVARIAEGVTRRYDAQYAALFAPYAASWPHGRGGMRITGEIMDFADAQSELRCRVTFALPGAGDGKKHEGTGGRSKKTPNPKTVLRSKSGWPSNHLTAPSALRYALHCASSRSFAMKEPYLLVVLDLFRATAIARLVARYSIHATGLRLRGRRKKRGKRGKSNDRFLCRSESCGKKRLFRRPRRRSSVYRTGLTLHMPRPKP